MRALTILGLVTLLTAAGYLIVWAFLNSTAAHAHEAGPRITQQMPPIAPIPEGKQPLGWKYPWMCCSGMDCEEVGDSAVEERPEGYVIKRTGEVVAYNDKRIKESPDGKFHWCAHRQGADAGHTICLFVPPKGF